MTFRILGAWLIAWGLMSLMMGLVGLHLWFLWFLDALGPVAGYCLKIGLIVLGIVLWRKEGSMSAVEDDEEPNESGRHPYLPVIVGGLVAVGALAFVVVGIVRDHVAERELTRRAPPAAWASKPAADWPALVLLQKARFRSHTDMSAGCASLVRLPGEQVVGLTAAHLLGRAGGVEPGFAGPLAGLDPKKLGTLDKEIVSWKLFLPEDEESNVTVAGLFGEAKQFGECADQVLLRLSPGSAGYPAQPLDLRFSPVAVGESLRVVRCAYDEEGNLYQTVHRATRVPGLLFSGELEKPFNLDGSSGAPVLDKDGLLVGVVTGGLPDPMAPAGRIRIFCAHSVGELLPVLKAAAGSKPAGSGTPVVRVNSKAAKARQKAPDKKPKGNKNDTLARL